MNEFLLECLRIALITLRYGGLIIAVVGAILWAISKKSTRNKKRGIWLLYIGAFMFIIYIGWDSFMSFISYFTEIGYLNRP